MARSFMPSFFSRAQSAPSEIVTETKMLTIPGYSSISNMRMGSNVYGTEGRADAWDMDTVITEGYERDVWVFRCVELMAGHAARLPFAAGKHLGTDVEERLLDHPLFRVMNKRSNPLEKSYAFRKRLSAQLLLSKRGVFVEVVKSRAGRIVRLDLLDPSRCRPIPDPDGDYIAHFEYTRRNGEVREIDPSRIRWIREPHPTDPFSGVTPLEAAGMSIELDFLSRLYNNSFIKNDAKPAGVLGVDSDSLSDQEMDRLERKFKPGAQHAGEMTVIGTGPGGMAWVDTSTKPRDMAYEHASSNAKNEILSAFGIGESLLGNAAGRTYDNAESELYSFWTTVMPPHLSLIAAAFDEDLDDEWDPFFDVSGIEVLELPRRRDREEARNEVQYGLRSIDEYRPLNGLKPLNTPQTRALFVSPSKAPIPGRPEDAAALGLAPGGDMGGDMSGMPPEGGPDGAPPAGPGGGGAQTGAEAVAEARAAADGAAEGAQDGSDATFGAGDAAAAVDEARGFTQNDPPVDGPAHQAVDEASDELLGAPGDAADAVEEARRAKLEGKSLETKSALDPNEPVTLDLDESQAATLAMAVKAALDALMARQQAVINARLESPKTRKGTKFWNAQDDADTRAGQEPLDAAKVVDAERWSLETLNTVAPLTGQAGTAASEAMLAELVAAGVLVGAGAALSATAGQIALAPAMAGAAIATQAMDGMLSLLTTRIRTSALSTSRISDVMDDVAEFYRQSADDLSRGVANSIAYSVLNGARDATMESLVALPGAAAATTANVAEWRTVGDAHVRAEHAAAAGQRRLVGEPFDIGGYPLRYPADPLGPPHLVLGCRCHLRYRVDGTARLIAPPA